VVTPTFTGVRTFDDVDLAVLAEHIDWTPFFHAWGLRGRYPAILDDAELGDAAVPLWDDARRMLDRIVTERWFAPQAVVGFWPAHRDGDDIVLASDGRRLFDRRLHGLRQQLQRRDGKPNLSIADFIAPLDAVVTDHVGAFVVTAGPEEVEIAERYEIGHDDYSAILVKALADRFAEAMAEYTHARVRRELWAYAPGEAFTPEELIGEPYRGIRPAPGYPAQPDHSEKATIFELLDAERRIGVGLTESWAMTPGSSVSGLYFAHPDAAYFAVGKIQRDQLEDYAARKGWTVEHAERLLGPNLTG
jgi:5-methyltetrahydrofolate--homocysteine methyltransferase